MEEKLRPGVFSSYSAGGQPGGWGRRFAGLIVSGVTAPGSSGVGGNRGRSCQSSGCPGGESGTGCL